MVSICVNKFKYLRVVVRGHWRFSGELEQRFSAALSQYCDEMRAEPEGTTLNVSIIPSLAFGHKLWAMRERTNHRYRWAKLGFLRCVADSTLEQEAQSSFRSSE